MKISNSGKITEITRQHGTPLGLIQDQKYASDQFQLKEEGKLILYTDGIPEALNLKDLQYGSDRLIRTAEKISKGPFNAKEICNLLIADVTKFRGEKPQSDDITVLSIIRNSKKS